ncbi:MAG: iron-containing alcohol dehydrogenase [Bacillota bacterium]
MDLFKYFGSISEFDTLNEFFKNNDFQNNDLIFTSKRIENNFLKHIDFKGKVITHNKFGKGEPSNTKIDKIFEEIKKIQFNQIIAIGGGSVIDIAKILTLKPTDDCLLYFHNKMHIQKNHSLIAIPTTCGTGSEVTNISICYDSIKETKVGLSHNYLYPEKAVLIPELLKNIPYKIYMHSSIDALIHSIEGFLSSNSSTYSDILAKKSIKMIIEIYKDLIEDKNNLQTKKMLKASNLAGLAFGNAGVGAVHALSYPLGGKYHVPHGESNFLFLNEVLKKYKSIKPDGKILELEKIINSILKTDKGIVSLNNLIINLIERKPLREYGMTREEIKSFSKLVKKTQTRLLKNNYCKLNVDDFESIYKNLF